MGRIRVTQIFPWLLPLRRRQRVFCFYEKMRRDGNRYAKAKLDRALPYEVFSSTCPLYNAETGFDMRYQQNKVFNLKLAAARLEGVAIGPGETFSFWQLVRHADSVTPYKSALTELDGRLQTARGGGLCQLSNLLFWLFLHTPLTIVERHGHAKKDFPEPPSDAPLGVDATVYEGWLDLKVKNNTSHTYQLSVTFDGNYIEGAILCDSRKCGDYRIYNRFCEYVRRNGVIYQEADVTREWISCFSGKRVIKTLYKNSCIIDYPLPENITVRESENADTGKETFRRQTEKNSEADSVAEKEGY